jgi:hypothetical protein
VFCVGDRVVFESAGKGDQGFVSEDKYLNLTTEHSE